MVCYLLDPSPHRYWMWTASSHFKQQKYKIFIFTSIFRFSIKDTLKQVQTILPFPGLWESFTKFHFLQCESLTFCKSLFIFGSIHQHTAIMTKCYKSLILISAQPSVKVHIQKTSHITYLYMYKIIKTKYETVQMLYGTVKDESEKGYISAVPNIHLELNIIIID